jgi:hypothetical protein
MKHNQPGGIAVLLIDLHLHACGRSALAKLGEVFEPFACATGESDVRRGCVKEKQLRLRNRCKTQRTVKRSFARLVEIDRAENARKSPHAVTSTVSGKGFDRRLLRRQAETDRHR